MGRMVTIPGLPGAVWWWALVTSGVSGYSHLGAPRQSTHTGPTTPHPTPPPNTTARALAIIGFLCPISAEGLM
jgi:hypothetical protein